MTRSRLQDLIDLANEPSSEKRRELLREITDLFMDASGALGAPQIALFDDVMSQLSVEMEEEVRVELAGRLADADIAPDNLLKALSTDTINVAEPILTRSKLLTEDHLVHVAQTMGQAHLRAVSKRASVPERVSDEIVRRGDDTTLKVLLTNEGAKLSRESCETVVDRAHANNDLHAAVVDRRDLPADLLNEMYFVVEARLRAKIMERNAELDPAVLEQALTKGRRRVAARDGALPADFDEAQAYVRELRAAGELQPRVLARFLRAGGMTHFLVALSQLADIDFFTARHIVERKELDALAIVCKAADMERALFLTYAVVLLSKESDAMGRAQEYGRMYADLPRETALRTLRFWRLRKGVDEGLQAA